MKKMIFLLMAAILIIGSIDIHAQLIFGKTSRGDLAEVTLVSGTCLASADSNGYSTAMRVPSSCGTLIIQTVISSGSTGDSLYFVPYGSADGTTYTAMTQSSTIGGTGASSLLTTISNPPNYVKLRSYWTGSSIAITCTIKANAKVN